MCLQTNLELLFQDYFELVLGADMVLLRADLFADLHRRCHLAFLAERNGKQFLLDSEGTLLYTADRIRPLFLPRQDEAILEAIGALLVALPPESSRDDRRELALQVMDQLSLPSAALMPAYLVTHGDKTGVIAPDGNYIIEPEYAQISPLAVFSQYVPNTREVGMGGMVGDAALLVCHHSATPPGRVDVFSTTGELVFLDLEAFYPNETKIITPKRNTAARLRPPRCENILCFCAECHSPETGLQERLYTTQSLFEPLRPGELRHAPLTRQSAWTHLRYPLQYTTDAAALHTFLHPYLCRVAAKMGVSEDDMIRDLDCYHHFRQIDTPILAGLFDHKLEVVFGEMSVRAHQLLRNMGVHTVRQLHALPAEALLGIAAPRLRQEIRWIKQRIARSAKEPPT